MVLLLITVVLFATTGVFIFKGVSHRKKKKKTSYIFFGFGAIMILFISILAFKMFSPMFLPKKIDIETPTGVVSIFENNIDKLEKYIVEENTEKIDDLLSKHPELLYYISPNDNDLITKAVELVDLDLDLEMIEQTLVKDIECDESPQVTQVSVSMNCTGLIDKTTRIENTYGRDVLSTGVIGLVGIPVDISSTSSFDQATIQFTYDEDLLGNTSEEDLRIMRYYGENSRYVILEKETVLDTKNNTLSITTSRFATYLVVDRQKWYDVWN